MVEVVATNAEVTGTSANAYPSTFQYQNKKIGFQDHKYLIVENTGATNSIDYRVQVQDGLNTDLRLLTINGATENAIALGVYDEVSMDGNYVDISVEVKSTSSGNHSTFSVRMTSRSNRL